MEEPLKKKKKKKSQSNIRTSSHGDGGVIKRVRGVKKRNQRNRRRLGRRS
jgi:hypothetical protein